MIINKTNKISHRFFSSKAVLLVLFTITLISIVFIAMVKNNFFLVNRLFPIRPTSTPISIQDFIKARYKNVEFEVPKEGTSDVYFDESPRHTYHLYFKFPKELRYQTTLPGTFISKSEKILVDDFKIEFSDKPKKRAYDKVISRFYKFGIIEGTYKEGFTQAEEFAAIEDEFTFSDNKGAEIQIEMVFIAGEKFRSSEQYKYAKSIFDHILETLAYIE